MPWAIPRFLCANCKNIHALHLRENNRLCLRNWYKFYWTVNIWFYHSYDMCPKLYPSHLNSLFHSLIEAFVSCLQKPEGQWCGINAYQSVKKRSYNGKFNQSVGNIVKFSLFSIRLLFFSEMSSMNDKYNIQSQLTELVERYNAEKMQNCRMQKHFLT